VLASAGFALRKFMLRKFINMLNNLPRDSRDTLFLLLVIATVVLPQVAYLPLWCSGLVAGVLVWRGTLAWKSQPLPSRWWLVIFLVIAVAATFATHRTILGRDAGVTLLVILLALKTLELRAQRDAFVVFFLGFFCMLSNFLFSQSLLTAFAMLVALMGLLTALVNAHMPVGKPPLMAAAKIAGKMALLGAPIMVVLFMLFPRLAPLWGTPGGPLQGKSGLSANMRVGTIANLALDDSIAMRIKFEGKPPAGREVYLRGPVLSNFDGREWLPALISNSPSNLKFSGQAFNYEVTLEPSNKPWLFALDAASTAPVLPGYQLRTTAELQWFTNRPITDLIRYKAQSHTQFSYGPETPDLSLQNDVKLPKGYNPRTLQLAADIKADARLANANKGADKDADAATLVNAVMQKLRTGGYEYTLEPGLYGDNTADEFWFDRKAGFCEHIASSFVVLMRAMGVPARIVTGYQGGEFNEVDGYWVVRQSDAHAWAEVWQAGKPNGSTAGSWVRVDPTSAVAPQRIDSLQRLTAPSSVFGGAIASLWTSTLGSSGYNPLLQLREVWDAVNNTWNQKILNYSEATQLNVLKNLGFTSPSWTDLSYVLIALIVAASLFGIAWTTWDKRQHDPWLRLLSTVRIRLAKIGLPSPANMPPRELALVTVKHFGESAQPLAAWLIQLEELRYRQHTSNRDFASLKSGLKSVPWPVK
jgi:protein-glutamine gamma-glutamyltransferase